MLYSVGVKGNVSDILLSCPQEKKKKKDLSLCLATLWLTSCLLTNINPTLYCEAPRLLRHGGGLWTEWQGEEVERTFSGELASPSALTWEPCTMKTDAREPHSTPSADSDPLWTCQEKMHSWRLKALTWPLTYQEDPSSTPFPAGKPSPDTNMPE